MTEPNKQLSSRLRGETKEAHTAAERSGVMRRLLRGTIDQQSYVNLLANLAVLYEALEEGLDANSQIPALSGVEWNALRRLPALRHDIASLSDPATERRITPGTEHYAAHLRALGKASPELLFAHAYLRYLGDLYGGQIIKGIITETLGPVASGAVSFYEFDSINNLNEFKAHFRGAIDAITSDDADHDLIVAEALLGYELHARIFQELED